jgi:putative MATE family efflux protein
LRAGKQDRNKAQQRREAMGKDSIWRLIQRFSGPAIISMTVASSYNLVDAIFVGKLGPSALAAMSTTFPLSLSFIAIASGTAMGVTSLIARNLGTGENENADRTASVAITLCFLLSAIILAICLPVLNGILSALGASGEVLQLARSYMFILIIFNVFSYLSLVLASIIRADGNPVFSSSISISTAFLNIALDPVFIFGFGPVPALGIQGAAIATIIAQAMGTAVFLLYIISGRTGYKFQAEYFLPDLRIVTGIYKVGMASIVRSGAQFVVMGIINNTAASFGVVPLAITGVLLRAGRFIQMPVLGLGQGIVPVIGYNYGAQRKTRVAEVVFKMALAGTLWTLVCWLVIMLFPTWVMSVFSGESEFLNEGALAIRLYMLAFFTLGLRMVPGFLFQGIGKGFPATVLTTAQNIGFLLPLVLILPRFFGLTGLWLAFPIADALALLLGQLWMNFALRRQGISFFWWKTMTARE